VWTKRTWKKYRKGVLAGGMLLTLAILTAVAVYTYAAYQRTASDLVVERDRQLAYLSAASFREEMTRYADDLVVVARMLGSTAINEAILKSTVSQTLSRLNTFDDGIVILDQQGKVVMCAPERPEIIGADWSDRTFFRELLSSSSIYVSDATSDGYSGGNVVAMSVPIVSAAGELGGSVVGMFRVGSPTTSALYARIIRLRLGQSGNTYIIDGNGQVLYDSAYRDASNPLRMSGLPAGFMGTLGAMRTRDANGNDIVAAHAGIPGTRWTLVSEDDWATLSAPARRNATNLLFLLGFGIVLPPLGVALLLREQRNDNSASERAEQEVRVANLIQTMLLPRQLPTIPGWDIAIHYQPAHTGGRDFYDFLFRPDGSLMLAMGEVNESGLMAAHVISTVRATLRGAAQRQLPPHEALDCSNELLCPDITPGVSLRCLCAIISPGDGRIQYASAGFSAPYVYKEHSRQHLPAGGPPLGELLAARYQDHDALHQPGERFVLYTSGLVETRNARRDVFGAERLHAILEREHSSAQQVVATLISQVAAFRGTGRDPENDFVIAVLQRADSADATAALEPSESVPS
jgi:hypothetical protein